MMHLDESTKAEIERTRRWIRALSRTVWRRATNEPVPAGTTTTDRERLRSVGIDLPPAAELDDCELSTILWRVIDALGELGTYLLHTDHLSDRELYEELAGDLLDEPIEIPAPDGAMEIVDLIGGWGPEDCQIYLRYYADEFFRRTWGMDFPEDPMPRSEKPPWDRDRWLPTPWSPLDDEPVQ